MNTLSMNTREEKKNPDWLRVLILFAAAFWLMGLGGGNEGSSGPSVPIPQKNFTAKVVDRSGNTLEAKRFSWEGKVYFRAQVGNATVSLPFAKIRSLRVGGGGKGASPDLLQASVVLKNGDTVEVMIDRGSKCFGETKFGNYEIFLKDVASIEFQ